MYLIVANCIPHSQDLESHLNAHVTALSPNHLKPLTSGAFFQLEAGLRQERNGQVKVAVP